MAACGGLQSVKHIDLRTEGPIVNGRAFLDSGLFLAFYYNQVSTTQAFALVKDDQRIWGIDFDRQRGWHLHPIENPLDHAPIEAQSILSIIHALQKALNRPQA
jgi:hypothetical protein